MCVNAYVYETNYQIKIKKYIFLLKVRQNFRLNLVEQIGLIHTQSMILIKHLTILLKILKGYMFNPKLSLTLAGDPANKKNISPGLDLLLDSVSDIESRNRFTLGSLT